MLSIKYRQSDSTRSQYCKETTINDQLELVTDGEIFDQLDLLDDTEQVELLGAGATVRVYSVNLDSTNV